jgi:hypothetical protein
MRTCLLAALALVVSSAGCTALKPSHREYKSTKDSAAFNSQPQHQIQQVQYVEPAGPYAAQPPAPQFAQPGQNIAQPAGQQFVQPAGHLMAGHGMHAMGGYGACPGGNCPGYGGRPGPFGHHGHQGYGGPRGFHKLFDGGRYGAFNGAHGTPGYPHHHFSREYVGPQGPPTAQVAYPYYTIRGPRDFLLDNPPSIGR